MVEDRLQEKRISFTLMGGKYKPEIALFGEPLVAKGLTPLMLPTPCILVNSADTITGRAASADTKRTYQGVKFLVGLANRLE